MKAKSTPAPSQWAITWGLTKYALRATFRNKASYFFSLIFPLIFVAVFGFIGSGSSSITIGIDPSVSHSNPVYQALTSIAQQDNSPIELEEKDYSTLQTELNKRTIAGIVSDDSPTTPEVTLTTSNGNPQEGAQAQSFLNGIMNQLNLKAAGVTNPPFKVATKELSGKKFSYIDFALPGQIGFSLLSIATFGIAFPLITLRKTLVLKRMFATAAKPISFVVSQCLARSFQAMLQAVVILVVGILGFHFSLAHGFVSAANMMILSFMGILAFLGFGILIGNIARDEQTLPIAINLFNLPQILLAGVFFPIDSMPKWAQAIGNNLPLAYLNNAMRHVASDGASLVSQWPYIVGMIAWGIVAYIAAAAVFKAE